MGKRLEENPRAVDKGRIMSVSPGIGNFSNSGTKKRDNPEKF
jgi:hypothetical protein